MLDFSFFVAISLHETYIAGVYADLTYAKYVISVSNKLNMGLGWG